MYCHGPAFLILILALMSGSILHADEPIRSARELYRSTFMEADAVRTFSITATVSAVNFEASSKTIELALQDDSGAIGVIYNDRTLPVRLQAGDKIEARGQITALHGWKRQCELTEAVLLSHGLPPPHQQRTIRDLLSGRHDFEPVQIRATVREAIRGIDNPQWTALGLIDAGYDLVVPVHANAAEYHRLTTLIGQDVLVSGFCSPTDPSLLHTGRQIRICDPSAIRPAPPSPATAPPPSIDAIANLAPDAIRCLGQHRATGTVLAVWQDRHVLIRTANDMAVRLSLRTGPTPRLGDRIEAIGFPESNFISFTLLHATFRTLEHVGKDPTKPQPLSFRTIPDEKDGTLTPTRINHGHLVRVRGRIISIFGENGRRKLDLDTPEGRLRIEAEPLAGLLDSLSPGCEVKIIGVCVLEAVAWHAIRPIYTGLLIVPRGPEDLHVLSRPSWWTPQRLMGVIGALLALLLGILIWNSALRRAALRKGRELLHEQIRQLKAETKTLERTRLAVELHDSLAQNLAGVSLEITTAERYAKTDQEATLKHLAFASKALNSCRSSLRDNLWDLRSHSLEEPDFDAAIRQTLLPHLKGISLDIHFTALRSRFPDNIMHDILCIIRELVINGIRHGGATQIKIDGACEGTSVLFSVTDNGRGFDSAHCPGVSEGHYGLQGIRERLRNLHGTLTFESIHPQGSKANVTLSLPNM